MNSSVDDDIPTARKSMKNHTNNKVFLPFHLLLDHILPRLPIKTLIRFKSVSKSWYSSISSSQFANLRLRLSRPSDHYKLFFLVICQFSPQLKRPTSYFFTLSYDDFNNLKDPVNIIHPVKISGKPVGSGNGLVCVCSSRKGIFNFYICNPATRQYHKITNPESQDISLKVDYWFGYVPSIDDYKIVAAFQDRHSIHKKYYVFSLNAREWKMMKDTEKFMKQVPIYFNTRHKLCIGTKVIHNILFWSLQVITKDMPLPVFGFDLVNEQFREFPSLEWLNLTADGSYYYYHVSFLEINGCLAIFAQTKPLVSEIWILKQFDNWSSWEKLSSYNDRVNFFNVTSTGKYLVWEISHENNQAVTNFKIIDPSDKDAEILESQGLTFLEHGSRICIYNALDYVESLISPFGKFNSINSS